VLKAPPGGRDPSFHFSLAPATLPGAVSIYLELTREFNAGRLRAIISSGQAVVLHRLAVMSKDGDWILCEDSEATGHVLRVLARRGARYRFGAPLDVRWLAGGWSSHFEFPHERLRVRCDFVTRPPRITPQELDQVWREQVGNEPPVVGLRHLAEIKKTNREKDYAVIGELARAMTEPREQLLHSRSARDLVALAEQQSQLVAELAAVRPILRQIAAGRERLEAALDAERRELIRANEARLAAYEEAAERWAALWPQVERETRGLALLDAHALIVTRAEAVLPFQRSKTS
jgi:hypothetical protein